MDSRYTIWNHYSVAFDCILLYNKFHIMCEADGLYRYCYTEYYNSMNYVSSEPTSKHKITNIYNPIIESRCLKSAILNMNHSDSLIRLISKFIICTKGDYIIE